MENKFAKIIKEKRTAKKLSLRKCADELGISPTYLSKIEDERNLPPSGEVIQKLSNLLEIDLTELNILANEYLDAVGKNKTTQNIRVPYSEKVPGFLRSVSKHVKNPEDWDAIAKIIEEQRGKSDE